MSEVENIYIEHVKQEHNEVSRNDGIGVVAHHIEMNQRKTQVGTNYYEFAEPPQTTTSFIPLYDKFWGKSCLLQYFSLTNFCG